MTISFFTIKFKIPLFNFNLLAKSVMRSVKTVGKAKLNGLLSKRDLISERDRNSQWR